MNQALRVALVCPYSFSRDGGVQNHVLGLAGWLRRQGHQVRVLGPGRPRAEALDDTALAAEWFTSTGPGVPLRYNGSVARVGFGPRTVRTVQRWLAGVEPDVVHVHEPMTPSASLLALASATVPVVATYHTATPGSRAMHLAYRMMPDVARRPSSAMAVSRVAQQVALRHGAPWAEVVGNGIDLASHPHPPAPRAGLRDGSGAWRGGPAPRLAFVGRHAEPRKGFDVLLRALPPIRAQYPHLEVVVVGPDRPRDATRHPGVVFLGPLHDRLRNQVLANSDVYVAPHLGRESFGIVLLEAMASGAPVVASDLPAFREVVCDERGPVADLFPPGNAAALAEAVLRSLARPRDHWYSRGLRRAAGFDWEHVGPRVERHYRGAVGPIA